MTLFSFEGPSRGGKTTTMDILLDRRPTWVEVTGPSLPERTSDDFCEAWRQEMTLRKPIFEANPQNVFLANRQFSEIAYTHSEEVKQYVKRTLAMWDDVHIIYLTANNDVLQDRHSPDLAEIEEDYRPMLEAFPSKIINTDTQDPIDAANEVEEYIFRVVA